MSFVTAVVGIFLLSGFKMDFPLDAVSPLPPCCLRNDTRALFKVLLQPCFGLAAQAWPGAQSGRGDPTSRRELSLLPLARERAALPKTVVLAYRRPADGH